MGDAFFDFVLQMELQLLIELLFHTGAAQD
jgi:hypothetical protein